MFIVPPPNRRFICANWKMNGSIKLIDDYASNCTATNTYTRIVVFPPYPYIPICVDTMKRSAVSNIIFTGAQEVSHIKSGSYTSEVSMDMLAEVGCTHVLIGHSEVRAKHENRPEEYARKIHAAMEAGIVPVYCVGEGYDIFNENSSMIYVERQMRSVMEGRFDRIVNKAGLEDFIVAYEPCWAIGRQVDIPYEYVNDMIGHIRLCIERNIGRVLKCSYIYGGNVTTSNYEELMSLSNVDGLLIGRTSLNVRDFFTICNKYLK